MLSHDILERVYGELLARDRARMAIALPVFSVSKIDKKLGMLMYAQKHGSLTMTLVNAEFIVDNINSPTAKALMDAHKNHATFRLITLKSDMVNGTLHNDMTKYPTKEDFDDFSFRYTIAIAMGTLSPENFNAFLNFPLFEHISHYPTTWSSFQVWIVTEACHNEKGLLLYLYRRIKSGDLPDWNASLFDGWYNYQYDLVNTEKLLAIIDGKPEQWKLLLKCAVNFGLFDLVDRLMTRGINFIV